MNNSSKLYPVRHLILAMIIILGIVPAKAQNLVPNGDMEAFTTCPTNPNYYVDLATGWMFPVGHNGTSDYFNSCGDPLHDWTNFANNTSVTPHSGNAYIGMITHSDFDQREYASIQLSSPLVAGQIYEVTFWAYNALGDYSSDVFCNNLGAYLSVNQPSVAGTGCGMCVGVYNVTPQVNETNVVPNQWTEISCEIVANGGEEWITIGNFFDNASTTITPNGALSMAAPPTTAYTFVDDVVVQISTGSSGTGGGINAGVDQTICSGQSATLTATLNNGGTATWTSVGGNFGPVNSNQITVSPTVTTSYVASFSGVCSNHMDTVTVTVDPTPTATISGGGSYCPGTPAPPITFNFTGTGPWDFSYSDGTTTTTITGITTSPYTINNAGVGTYTLTSLSGNCPGTVSGTATITLGVQADATITPVTPLCANNVPITLSAADPGGQWSGQGITDAVAGTFNPSIAGVGDHNIIYTISGSCGDADTISITVLSTDDASFNYSTNHFCIGQSHPQASIIGTTGGVFTITAPGIIDANSGEIDLTATGSGNFTVTYTTNGTCPDSSTVLITLEEQAIATITDAGPYCINDQADTLQATPVGGIWSGNGIDPNTGVFTPSLAGIGTSQLIYTTPGICGDSDTIDVVVYPAPIANAGQDQSVILNESIQLNGSGAGSYSWAAAGTLSCSNCPSPVATPTTSTVYTLTIVDANGCIGIDSVLITVNEDVIYYVPNAFTADGDEFNQLFKPVFTSGFDPFDYNLTIFNRWGETIFESNNHDIGWDGTYNGNTVQNGTYIWRIEFKEITSDKRQTITGHVTKLR